MSWAGAASDRPDQEQADWQSRAQSQRSELSGGGSGVGVGERQDERNEQDGEWDQAILRTSLSSNEISEGKSSMSAAVAGAGGGAGGEGTRGVGGLLSEFFCKAATEPAGATTSMTMTLSAISASASKAVASVVEARTIRTLCGNLCKKSSFSCILRSNCVGFLSPNSPLVTNCWSRRHSDWAVRLVSCSFRAVYGLSGGGLSRRSLTSAE